VAKLSQQRNHELSVVSNIGPSAASPMVRVGFSNEFPSFSGLPNSSVFRSAMHNAYQDVRFTHIAGSAVWARSKRGTRGLLSGMGLALSLFKISQVNLLTWRRSGWLLGIIPRFECVVGAAWNSLGTAWPQVGK